MLLLGVTTTATYGLCNQIFSLIVAVGKVYNNTMIPRYAALRLKKEKEKIQELFSISTVIYWGFCLIALSGMLMFGNSALDILKPGFYIPPILMILMALMHYFDGYSNLSTMVISTGNTVPYMKATIISSIGIIISYFIFYYNLLFYIFRSYTLRNVWFNNF